MSSFVLVVVVVAVQGSAALPLQRSTQRHHGVRIRQFVLSTPIATIVQF